MSESERFPALLPAEEPSFQCYADTQDFPYQSIRGILQQRLVEDIHPPGRRAALLKSISEISEIAFEVAKHPYFQQLGRPDYTRYTIDYKIWQRFFVDRNGKSSFPFTAIDPLNDRPLDPSSLSHNPFPVCANFMAFTNLSDTNHMRGGGDDSEIGSPASSDTTVKPRKQIGEDMIRSDSGYHSVCGKTCQGVQAVKHAQTSISTERKELERAVRRANRGARECEDKARYYNKQAVKMLGQAKRLELRIMALDDEEEDAFDAEERIMQATLERGMLDDEIKRLSQRCSRNEL